MLELPIEKPEQLMLELRGSEVWVLIRVSPAKIRKLNTTLSLAHLCPEKQYCEMCEGDKSRKIDSLGEWCVVSKSKWIEVLDIVRLESGFFFSTWEISSPSLLIHKSWWCSTCLWRLFLQLIASDWEQSKGSSSQGQCHNLGHL